MASKAPSHDFLTHYRLTATLGESVFYLKALSDGDLTTQKNHALLASHALRHKLRDPKSQEHGLHVLPLDDLDDDELADILLSGKVNLLWLETYAELPSTDVLPAPAPRADTGDPLEDQEQGLLSPLDDDKRQEASLARERRRVFTGKLDAARAEAQTLDRAALLKAATRAVIAEQCRQEHERARQKALVMLATYADPAFTQRLWDFSRDPEIPWDLVEALVEAYGEVGNISTRFLIGKC